MEGNFSEISDLYTGVSKNFETYVFLSWPKIIKSISGYPEKVLL